MHSPWGLDCAERSAKWKVGVQPGMGWRGRDEREGPWTEAQTSLFFPSLPLSNLALSNCILFAHLMSVKLHHTSFSVGTQFFIHVIDMEFSIL